MAKAKDLKINIQPEVKDGALTKMTKKMTKAFSKITGGGKQGLVGKVGADLKGAVGEIGKNLQAVAGKLAIPFAVVAATAALAALRQKKLLAALDIKSGKIGAMDSIADQTKATGMTAEDMIQGAGALSNSSSQENTFGLLQKYTKKAASEGRNVISGKDENGKEIGALDSMINDALAIAELRDRGDLFGAQQMAGDLFETRNLKDLQDVIDGAIEFRRKQEAPTEEEQKMTPEERYKNLYNLSKEEVQNGANATRASDKIMSQKGEQDFVNQWRENAESVKNNAGTGIIAIEKIESDKRMRQMQDLTEERLKDAVQWKSREEFVHKKVEDTLNGFVDKVQNCTEFLEQAGEKMGKLASYLNPFSYGKGAKETQNADGTTTVIPEENTKPDGAWM